MFWCCPSIPESGQETGQKNGRKGRGQRQNVGKILGPDRFLPDAFLVRNFLVNPFKKGFFIVWQGQSQFSISLIFMHFLLSPSSNVLLLPIIGVKESICGRWMAKSCPRRAQKAILCCRWPLMCANGSFFKRLSINGHWTRVRG